MNLSRPPRWFVNIVWGNGLVQSHKKPLSEPVLSQISVAAVKVYFTHIGSHSIGVAEAETNFTSFPRRHFQCIFLNEDVSISLKISLKFVHKVRINIIPALVQIMAWCQPGDKPLSEPMMVSLLMYICVTRPQWVKCMPHSDASLGNVGKLVTQIAINETQQNPYKFYMVYCRSILFLLRLICDHPAGSDQ